MKQTQITCDKCKESVIVESFYRSGYKTVELKLGDRHYSTYDLCPKCLEKYGLPVGKIPETPVQYTSQADKLYEIIAEIVAENIIE